MSDRPLAKKFRIENSVRRRIKNTVVYKDAFHWHVVNKEIRLRRSAPGQIWAAEPLLYFQRNDWWKGIPQPHIIRIVPYFLPKTSDQLAMYRVTDFKGLESDVVILVLRGHMPKHKESLYVGISRARVKLLVLADDLAISSFPKSFMWD